MSSGTVHVKGLAQLDKFLQQLPAKMERNVLRGALRAGAKPMRDQAKANAWVESGELRRGIKVVGGAKGGRVVAKVVVTGKHAFIAPWLEYGVAAHQITARKGGWLSFAGGVYRSVDHPGLQARPVFRPAFDNNVAAAVVAAAQYIKRRLATKHGLDTADVEIEEL